MKQRIQYFDILKGLAMFSVVNWHLMNNIGGDAMSTFIYRVMDMLQLPIFMFVAGFFCYRSNGTNKFIVPNLRRRAVQLLLPVLSCGLLWVFRQSYLTPPICISLIDNAVSLVRGSNPFYFLICVFVLYYMYALVAVICRMFRKDIASLTIAVLYMILVIMYFRMPEEITKMFFLESIVLRFYIPFMVGVLCNRYRTQYEMSITYSPIVYGAVVAFILLSCWSAFDWIGMPSGIGFVAVQIQVIMAIFLMTILCRRWEAIVNDKEAGRLWRYFILLGQNSLIIYTFHYFFRFSLSGLDTLLSSTGYASVAVMAVTLPIAICIIWCCITVNKIIKAIPGLEFIFTGKTIS